MAGPSGPALLIPLFRRKPYLAGVAGLPATGLPVPSGFPATKLPVPSGFPATKLPLPSGFPATKLPVPCGPVFCVPPAVWANAVALARRPAATTASLSVFIGVLRFHRTVIAPTVPHYEGRLLSLSVPLVTFRTRPTAFPPCASPPTIAQFSRLPTLRDRAAAIHGHRCFPFATLPTA